MKSWGEGLFLLEFPSGSSDMKWKRMKNRKPPPRWDIGFLFSFL